VELDGFFCSEGMDSFFCNDGMDGFFWREAMEGFFCNVEPSFWYTPAICNDDWRILGAGFTKLSSPCNNRFKFMEPLDGEILLNFEGDTRVRLGSGIRVGELSCLIGDERSRLAGLARVGAAKEGAAPNTGVAWCRRTFWPKTGICDVCGECECCRE